MTLLLIHPKARRLVASVVELFTLQFTINYLMVSLNLDWRDVCSMHI
jgi:hypothetical protein